MSRYLLDTGPLVGLLFGRPGAVDLFRPWMIRQEVLTTFLAYGEAFEHLMSQPNHELHSRALKNLVAQIRPIGLDMVLVERYAILRRSLRPPHGPGLIGDVDTLIAATAIVHDLTVVTTDSDFMRVPELRVLWLRPKTFEPVVPSSV